MFRNWTFGAKFGFGFVCLFIALAIIGGSAPPREPLIPSTSRVVGQPIATRAGYSFCLTEEAYDQLITAKVEKDQRAQNFLFEAGVCGPTLKGGLPVTVLDRTWTGVVQASRPSHCSHSPFGTWLVTATSRPPVTISEALT